MPVSPKAPRYFSCGILKDWNDLINGFVFKSVGRSRSGSRSSDLLARGKYRARDFGKLRIFIIY